jgi:RNA polymerase sigma-70 factor (ECF subfamily)
MRAASPAREDPSAGSSALGPTGATAVAPRDSRDARARIDEKTARELRVRAAAFFRRRVADAALAEDLTQQTMLQALKGIPRFRGAATLGTWVRRIAENVLRDHLRREAARPTDRAVETEEFSVAALLDDIGPDQSSSTAEAVHDRRATHECLLTAVRRLPLEMRRVVLLCDFGEMPLEQAAAALGCAVGTAKVRLHRGRRRVAEICRAGCVPDHGPAGELLCTPRTTPRRAVASPPQRRRRRTEGR